MEYITNTGTVITDEQLEAEAKALERDEWPETWDSTPPRIVNVSLPAWMIDAADREARRLAVPRKSVLNMWIAKGAEEALAHA